MGYTFGFGTRFAAPILGLAILGTNLMASALIAAVPLPTDVTLNVSGLRNGKGQLMVCLTRNPKAFPDCTKDGSAVRKLVPASQAASMTFEGIAPGTYAVAIVHDENGNNKMDLRLFIPREGFAFSRNPAIGMGPPKFGSAAFIVGAEHVNQSVKMKYMF
jgi:uncharacterized protein (DUF2141 family)